MKEKSKRIYHYLLTQLSEPSTWRGIILVLTGCGAMFSEELKEGIMAMGVLIAGLIGAAVPDKLKDKE